jgi:hypothetical protein
LFNLGASSDNYAPGMALYDAAGAPLAKNINGSLYANLSAGTPYIVQVSNIGNFTDYQFRMQAATPITIGGSVDYSGLPSSISSAIVSATVSAYLDNAAHTPVVTGVPVTGTSWTASVPANALGQTVRLVLTLNLDNNRSITSHIQAVLEDPASDLDFVPAPIATAINGKTTADRDDWLLLVPAAGGVYELQLQAENTYVWFSVYDGLTGNYIADAPGSDSSTGINLPLSAGNPYIIQIYVGGEIFHDYQFSFSELPPTTLGGTVGFTGLDPWTPDSAGVLIFSGSDYAVLETGAVSLPGGGWSVSASLPAEVFIAMVAQSTGGEGVLAAQTVTVSGDDSGIDFSPDDLDKDLATGAWHNRNTTAGARGDWLLWIPENTGTYVLDAERTDGSMDPYMYLYDGLTGTLITSDDDGGGNLNSHIQYSEFVGGHPYLIRVRDYSDRAGTFRFKAESVSP